HRPAPDKGMLGDTPKPPPWRDTSQRAGRRAAPAGARLPDEPDPGALPGRSAGVPRPAAPARRLGPLPGQPLRALPRLPLPRSRVRGVPPDRAVRDPNGARGTRPGGPGPARGLERG